MDPIATCTHIKTNGIVCNSPALRGHQLCYFHHQAKSRDELRYAVGFPFDPTIHVGSLEDPESVQIAINEIVHAVLDRRIDSARAKVCLYALQLAITNFKRMDKQLDPTRMATVLPEQPRRDQTSRADWPCKNEADELHTPIHASADSSCVGRAPSPAHAAATGSGAPVPPAFGGPGHVPSKSTGPVPSNSSVTSPAGAPSKPPVGLGGSVPSTTTDSFRQRISTLPAHIQRDLLAAHAGDLRAAKRLLKHLPKHTAKNLAFRF